MKKIYKTPAEVMKRFWSGFENSDLGQALERHLTNCIDNGGTLVCEYGMSMDDGTEEDGKWYIDVEDSSYWYHTADDRNFDIRFLEKVVTEFRKVNNLKQSPLYML